MKLSRAEQLQSAISDDETKLANAITARITAVASDASDKEIGAIDDNVIALRRSIDLNRERLTLAQDAQRQAEELAAQKAENDRLDAIAARAQKALDAGQRALSDYAKAANAIPAALAKLTVADDIVQECNRALVAAGRGAVPSANESRNRPMRFETQKVRRMVGVGEVEHPAYGFADIVDKRAIDRRTRLPIEPFIEMDVATRVTIPAVVNEPLQAAVALPPAAADDKPIWPAKFDRDQVLRSAGLA